jgi:hypothetical protein
VKIQAGWRGGYTRKLFESRSPGNPKNAHVTDALRKSWSLVEQNVQDNALFVFRTMFRLNPAMADFYPFARDEWNRISYVDYNGSHAEQPANSWFLLFRDIFHVPSSSNGGDEDVEPGSVTDAAGPVLLLPKVYTHLPNCMLKVINNDTYKEVPKVFNKLTPYTYVKNKRGYTMVAEGRALPNHTEPVAPGRWRLRLIGSSPALIAPRASKSEIVSLFDTREARDYYVPNEHRTILRYKATVVGNEDQHLTSLQITTSKSDVYVKLAILDNGVEVLSATGKGCAVIPAFIFLKDRSGQKTSRPASKTQNRKFSFFLRTSESQMNKK